MLTLALICVFWIAFSVRTWMLSLAPISDRLGWCWFHGISFALACTFLFYYLT